MSDRCLINMISFETPLGEMIACATEQGLCMLEFSGGSRPVKQFEDICRALDGVILPGSNTILAQVQKEIEEYFLGQRQQFSVRLIMPGTSFQQAVWEELLTIPYGKTISYRQQSLNMKKPDAIRAIASANGSNRIAIIVPCHRVIGSNGDLTGYAGGISKKKKLLDLERGTSPIQSELGFPE